MPRQCIISTVPYTFLHSSAMHNCISEGDGGWVGGVEYELVRVIGMNVVLACESLRVCTVCIWRCEPAWCFVEFFYAPYSFIHSKH